MKFNIPISFKLLGQKFHVEWSKKMVHHRDNVGEAYLRDNIILLQEPTESTLIPPDKVEHNFYHELVHHITYYAGDMVNKQLDSPLHTNEGFIDIFAGLLHQALSTMEHEKTERRGVLFSEGRQDLEERN